ncbi:hypothetical protein MJO29_004435 [Puccinia striiformis f. sp. tritici]|nr:hypothetical protein MJO29_004435 [Puccinia striiformis f. sp. tritici]
MPSTSVGPQRACCAIGLARAALKAGGPDHRPRSLQAHFLIFYKVKLKTVTRRQSLYLTSGSFDQSDEFHRASVDRCSQANFTQSLNMFSGAQQAPSPAQIALAQAEARRTMKGFVYTILTIRASWFLSYSTTSEAGYEWRCSAIDLNIKAAQRRTNTDVTRLL